MGARPRSKTVLFASCGPQIPFTWANAHWVYGLNIPDSTVLSIPSKLSHMDMLKSDFYTSFNWTCIISLLPAFYSYKKTEMYNMNVILDK